ncbi:MFS transporter [Singulisphaera sp. PoT]|uniref:MFS transporter n=1 Tax=Singulisphaera sp. PoT TaxID=3411797 RepID=UPI003BF58DE0
MSFGLRFRLCLMMFFQYYVWGIWLPMLAQRLGPNDLNLSVQSIGWIFTVYGFGSILGPFIIGQLADRYFATEKVMAMSHFIGGLLLIATAYATSFVPIFVLLLLYCSLYMPTMGLSNSITFRSLGEGNQNTFPSIRLWGTVGWIAAGLSFPFYIDYNNLGFYKDFFGLFHQDKAFASFLAAWQSSVVPHLKPLFAISWISEPGFRDCLRIPGVVSLIYGIYCLTLPHTPPSPAKETDPIDKKSAVLESLELMKHRSFAVLVVITGLIGIMLAFYFACENYFLESIGVRPTDTGAFMTLGQFAEAVVIGLVPLSVAKIGVKKTMLLGAGAWALRFGLSAYGKPQWLMISTIGLHGFAFGFFFVVAQMYVDRAASSDIKATAQNLLIFVVYGLGTVLGSALTGWVRAYNTTVVNGKSVENWTGNWMGPFILTLICMAAFALFFKEEEIGASKKELEPASEIA